MIGETQKDEGTRRGWQDRLRPAVALLAASAMAVAGGLSPATIPASGSLDNSYRYMYNLDFADAHNTLREWRAAHSVDPMGPASEAAAYLFAEFDRLHILQSDLFTDDRDFKGRSRPQADAQVKQRFLRDLDACEQLANNALSRNAQDDNAKFAKILALGLRSDYLALIEKRDFQSLRLMRTARAQAQELLAQDPSYYDAYVAVGVENYMLGIKPAPVRWLLSLTGSQTDLTRGIEELKLTAEKGHYLQPFARLLLAVAALRDKNKDQARDLLAGLAREFPKNELYKKELARLQ